MPLDRIPCPDREKEYNPAEQLEALVERVDRLACVKHAVAAVSTASVIEKPFPYMMVQNVFDAPTYAALLQLVRVDDLFRIEPGGTAYTILGYPELCGLGDHLDPAIRDHPKCGHTKGLF